MGEQTGKVRPWGTLNWPNRVSMIRLLLLAPFIVLVINQNDPHLGWARHAAVAVFALMAVSDFLDGVLARRLDARTRLGAILDPLADKALIICSVVLLSLPASAVWGYDLPNWVVVAVVGKAFTQRLTGIHLVTAEQASLPELSDPLRGTPGVYRVG